MKDEYYTGNWVDGKMEGFGERKSTLGTYIGNFKNNL